MPLSSRLIGRGLMCWESPAVLQDWLSRERNEKSDCLVAHSARLDGRW